MTTVGGALEAIVLAAGAGVRFGGGKLTAPWGDGVLIDGALAAAFAAPVRHVTVVTGADEGVAAAARAWAAAHAESPRLRVTHAADHARGMSASLNAGIAALPADTTAAFVFLGDMPTVPHSLASALSQALARCGAAACVPIVEGRRGHPVLFTAELFAALRALDGDRGARGLLDGLGERLTLVATADSGTLFDVDEPI